MLTFFFKPSKNAGLRMRPMTHFGQSGFELSALLIALLFALSLFMSCSDGSGGSSSSSGSSDLSSYTMPTEISAVPVDTGASDPSTALNRSFSSNLRALARAATDDTARAAPGAT